MLIPKLRSSYLCFSHSWGDMPVPPCPAFIGWDRVLRLRTVTLSISAGITGVSHMPSSYYMLWYQKSKSHRGENNMAILEFSHQNTEHMLTLCWISNSTIAIQNVLYKLFQSICSLKYAKDFIVYISKLRRIHPALKKSLKRKVCITGWTPK
jgi:hypothetical protein